MRADQLANLSVGTRASCLFTQPNDNLYIATGAVNHIITSNNYATELLAGARTTCVYGTTINNYSAKMSTFAGANSGATIFMKEREDVFATSFLMDKIGIGGFSSVKSTLTDWCGTKKDDLYFGLTHSAATIQSAMTPVFKAGGEVLSLLGQLKENFKAEHFGFNYKETEKQIIINLYITVSGDVTGKYAHLGNNNYYNI